MADNAEVLTDEQVALMTVPEIKDELRRRRLRLAGRKRELLDRLMAALKLEREHGAHDDDDEELDDDEAEDDEDEIVGSQRAIAQDDDEDDDEEDETNRGTPDIRRNRRRAEPSRTLLLLKDVEDSLDRFSGDDLLSISRWIEDFEEMAEVCGWNDVHKVAFGKKLLTGSALAFMRQERGSKTWAKFKKALTEEFGDIVTDQQIHRELTQRKKKQDETLQQYMYKMREIAAQGKVDTQSLIDYIIQGIPDEVTTKAVLYGARNLQQLKDRFKQYESMKREMEAKPKTAERKDDRKKGEEQSQPRRTGGEKRRCFNCGSDGHLSVRCPERDKGVKCFQCNGFGHFAADCGEKKKEAIKETYVVSRPEKKKYMKEVSIEDCKFISLVDTGSDLTFIRSDEYAKLGSPPLGSRKLQFEGFGSTGNETWGEFEKVMNVDGHEFKVILHVVSNKVMSKHSLLLGTDFLDQVELRVKRGEITFVRLEEQTNSREDAPDIFHINTVEQTAELDLSHVEEPHYREEIRDIIKDDKPEKTRDVGIAAKIELKNDKPVVRRPRRLATSENSEVDGLMKDFKDFIDKGVLILYMDDIIILAKSLKEALDRRLNTQLFVHTRNRTRSSAVSVCLFIEIGKVEYFDEPCAQQM
ncbi:uncharacterized protein [Atheta coriaria]|uniref:uncharacterized protein n=1 Tax=Dalotia coriaria TaxID=877792 RepID=UPI0031F4100C